MWFTSTSGQTYNLSGRGAVLACKFALFWHDSISFFLSPNSWCHVIYHVRADYAPSFLTSISRFFCYF